MRENELLRKFWLNQFLRLTYIMALENTDQKSFECTGAILRLHRTFSSAKANHFFDSTKMPKARYCNAEGSTTQRRGLDIVSASPRATS